MGDYADAIEGFLTSMSTDIGCLNFKRVDMLQSPYEHGLVFINGEVNADGNCWSAIGQAPGFVGNAQKTLTEFGAKETWQVISLSPPCGIDNKNTVQHEVGHALGRFHEFQRPDRDLKIEVSAAAASSNPAYTDEQFVSYQFPFDIGSSMMYCSQCVTGGTDPYDLVAKDGTHWGNLPGLTTLDALKTEANFCKGPTFTQPPNGYKNKVG